jgi:hypothetical protein
MPHPICTAFRIFPKRENANRPSDEAFRMGLENAFGPPIASHATDTNPLWGHASANDVASAS